ncbi:MAG: hypothetical protein KF878_05130 [Planctomycetes bacterium]|nr:hypothetical protein [Planctomycetota bacterium]
MEKELSAAEDCFRRTGETAAAMEVLVAGERARKPSQVVLRAVLTLARWTALPREAKESAARNVEILIGRPLRFSGLQTHALGDHSNTTAHFDWRGRELALIPAGREQVGFDVESFRPSDDLLQRISPRPTRAQAPVDTHQALALFHDVARDIHPVREVSLSPYLIEVVSTGWPGWGFFGAPVDVHGFPDAEESEIRSALRSFRRDGFRAPTTDEWEFACAGGSRDLFRWGAEHPVSQSPWQEQPWDLHRSRNAFGLVLPHDTYDVELCLPWNLRGGDGGFQAHGGGDLLGWLTLASAYDATRVTREVAGLSIDEGNPSVRLVRPLFSM